jgi:N6-L-threonylcarbamoyladenine synthase
MSQPCWESVRRPISTIMPGIDQSPLRAPEKPILAIGLEGSANKIGVGIVEHSPDGSTKILSNVRHTYITPPGEGFQPRDTAIHHREWAINIVKAACKEAGVGLGGVDCICYTRGMLDNGPCRWLSYKSSIY